jgi:hypothetical protein
MMVFSSCQDFLSRDPGMQRSFEEQLSTQEGVLEALNGTYAELNAELSSNPYVYADLMGGNLTFTPNLTGSNTGQINVPPAYTLIYSFDDTEEETTFDSFYGGFYGLIAAANAILERLGEVAMEDLVRERVQSELYAIRAFCHFELVRLYGQHYSFTADASHLGIVNADRTFEIGVDFPARNTVAENYALIIADLQRALALGDDEPALSFFQGTGYFTKLAIRALLARVYLYQENWPAALAQADSVIQDGRIALLSAENYVEEWTAPDLPVSETILEFAVRRSDAEGTVGFSISSFFELPIQNQAGDYAASGDLVDLYSNTDIRKADLLESVALPTIIDEVEVATDYYFTRKLQDNPGVPVLRLSEIYLIRAEAYAQLDNIPAGLYDLELIRRRADSAAPSLGALNQTELLDAIFLERRKELAFERHLFFDIKRTRRDVVRTQGCLARTCDLSYPNAKFVLPIPQQTLNVNPNMVQNEGY